VMLMQPAIDPPHYVSTDPREENRRARSHAGTRFYGKETPRSPCRECRRSCQRDQRGRLRRARSVNERHRLDSLLNRRLSRDSVVSITRLIICRVTIGRPYSGRRWNCRSSFESARRRLPPSGREVIVTSLLPFSTVLQPISVPHGGHELPLASWRIASIEPAAELPSNDIGSSCASDDAW